MDVWLTGVYIVGTSSILGAINFNVTILNMRAPGMTLHKMSLLTWTVLVQSIMVLFSTPALAAAVSLLFIQRNLGAGFFGAQGDPVLLAQKSTLVGRLVPGSATESWHVTASRNTPRQEILARTDRGPSPRRNHDSKGEEPHLQVADYTAM